MKRFLLAMLSLSILLFGGSALAFNPPIAEPGRFMYDLSGKVSTSDANQINQRLLNLNKNTKNEIAVLVIDSLGDDAIDDAANATFKKWGIGKKGLDNGVLIMLALGDHKMRIETGKGVEGELTDLQTQDIMVHKMRPMLKSGNVSGAINAGIDGVTSTLESRKADAGNNTTAATPTTNPNVSACDVTRPGDNTGLGWIAGVGLGAVVLLLIGRVLFRQRRPSFDEAPPEIEAPLPVAQVQPKKVVPPPLPSFPKATPKLDMDGIAKGLGAKRIGKVPSFNPVYGALPPDEWMGKTAGEIADKGAIKHNKVSPTIVAEAAGAAALSELLVAQRELARQKAEREEEERAAARRAREDDERRDRERREEDDRRRSYESSSSSSSSSFDWGSSGGDSSSSGGGFGGDSGGGFGGGDSGGGGSDSSW